MEASKENIEPEELDIFRQIKKELSVESTKEAVQLVASVLHALRQTLSVQNATALINKLPDFLKLIFAANWKRDEPQVKIEHLDEFVNLVMERDRKSKKFLFKSDDVFVLSVIILTLKKLYKVVDLDTLGGVSPAFRQELREVPAEAVAA